MAPANPTNHRRHDPIRSLISGPLRIEVTNEEILADLRYPAATQPRRANRSRSA